MVDEPLEFLILGAGNLAREVAQFALDCGGPKLVGFVECVTRDRCESSPDGIPVHWIDDIAPLAATTACIAAIGSPERKGSIERVEKMGFQFTSLVHPTVHAAGNAKVGAGTVIGPAAVLASAASIGRHVYINRGTLIGHDTSIGDFCTVGPGANIAGNCVIGNESYIGIGAVFLDKITLGANSTVAAGAVVTKSFPARSQIRGLPAKAHPG